MKRALFALVLLYWAWQCPAVFAANTPFRGVTPGVSTMDDTARILGKPVSKIIESNQTVFRYRFGAVNFPKKTGKAQHIVINDQTFRDVNGFRLGSKYSEVQEQLNVNGTKGALLDQANGILYVFDQDGLVDRIIYGANPQ
jgi:hypothetical protein